MAPPALDVHSGEVFVGSASIEKTPSNYQTLSFPKSRVTGALSEVASGYTAVLSSKEQESDKFSQGFEVASQDFANRHANFPSWKAFLTEGKRFVIQPPCSERIVTSGKESLICLLDLAEELDCTEVIIVLPVQGNDFDLLVKAFMYLGFAPVPPSSAARPQNPEYFALSYTL